MIASHIFRHTILWASLLITSPALLAAEKEECVRIVSYNVENLFDTENDPLTDDDAFTPEGDHQWIEKKYKNKVNNLSRAITAAGGWETPILIGLCEIENERVLNDLFHHTQLRMHGYQFVHKDSPDLRGVDVALAYLPEKFKVFNTQFLKVEIVGDKPTRDILLASGILPNKDTLHVFVNHWPSRYGGELESEHKRIKAAQTLRQATDSLMRIYRAPKIIIMGDFNDYPYNSSIKEHLGATIPPKNIVGKQLYNLSSQFVGLGDMGTHKFGGEWGVLDQFIVSGALLNHKGKTYTSLDKVKICQEDFLLKDDKTGKAPKRAFRGTFYAYGYSDHLPIYLDIILKNHE